MPAVKTADTIKCSECDNEMPLRRKTVAGFDYCIPCGAKKPGDIYVLGASGFKNNGAEIVRVEQHIENQKHNHVRG